MADGVNTGAERSKDQRASGVRSRSPKPFVVGDLVSPRLPYLGGHTTRWFLRDRDESWGPGASVGVSVFSVGIVVEVLEPDRYGALGAVVHFPEGLIDAAQEEFQRPRAGSIQLRPAR